MLALTRNPFDILDDPNFPFNFSTLKVETSKIVKPFEGDTLELEVPGVKKEDIQVSIESSHLKVRWKNRKGVTETTFRNVGQVIGAKARLADGLLTITLERPDYAKPKTINVEVE